METGLFFSLLIPLLIKYSIGFRLFKQNSMKRNNEKQTELVIFWWMQWTTG
jgi:hypothetical protein